MNPRRFAIATATAAIATGSLVAAHRTDADAPTTTTTSTVQATTTTSTTIPATTTTPAPTTTTTTIPAGDWKCPQWIGLALEVGWPADELANLDAIIFRESTCRPDAYNGQDPSGGSAGGTQVNGIWLDWFLPSLGIAHTLDDLFDPEVNLKAALAIWQRSGWRPWGGHP